MSGIPLPPSNLRPFGAPPSIGRRECTREPLPLEGARRAQRGGVGFIFGGEAASFIPNSNKSFPAIHERPAYGLTPSHQSPVTSH